MEEASVQGERGYRLVERARRMVEWRDDALLRPGECRKSPAPAPAPMSSTSSARAGSSPKSSNRGEVMSFVHLHVHSQYSFLDGASTLEELLEKAVSLNMPALALTDHNRLTGAIRFYDKAKALGIKPIIGAEVDMAGGYHLTLLCKDAAGIFQPVPVTDQGPPFRPDRKPEATREMLPNYSGGLIALSGCDNGEIATLLSKGKREQGPGGGRILQGGLRQGLFHRAYPLPVEGGILRQPPARFPR